MTNLIQKEKIFSIIIFLVPLLLSACAQEKAKSQTNTSKNYRSTAKKDKQLKEAPDFTLEKMNGEMFTLSEHKNQVIVLNIWATWCPPCRKEIPGFIELQKQLQDKGVLFVGISVDREGWEVVRPFVKKYGINYPIMVDDGTIFKKYGPFRGIPTTFIINKKGKVEYVALGMINMKKLEKVLKKLAAQ